MIYVTRDVWPELGRGNCFSSGCHIERSRCNSSSGYNATEQWETKHWKQEKPCNQWEPVESNGCRLNGRLFEGQHFAWNIYSTRQYDSYAHATPESLLLYREV